MTIRPSLLVGGRDPATPAGQQHFLLLSAGEQARYLKRIEYLEGDVLALLALLDDDRRTEVLAYRDECASRLSVPAGAYSD